MHKAALISPALVVAGILAGAGVPFVMPPAAIRAQVASPAAASDFTTFLARVDAAQLELQNGRPAAFKALWSRADQVTLSGGFGGTIEKGWPAISSRLDWVATRPGDTSDSTRDYRVTMIFRRQAGGWRIVHRHADSQLTRQ